MAEHETVSWVIWTVIKISWYLYFVNENCLLSMQTYANLITVQIHVYSSDKIILNAIKSAWLWKGDI